MTDERRLTLDALIAKWREAVYTYSNGFGTVGALMKAGSDMADELASALRADAGVAGSVAETERRHSEDCRRQEQQRQREADALQAGFELGRADAGGPPRPLIFDPEHYPEDAAAIDAGGPPEPEKK